MTVVTLEEAKTRIDELAQRANEGEAVRIKDADGRELELRPVGTFASVRVGGQWAGKLEVGAEFFEPMPDDWLDAFENGPVFPDEADRDEQVQGPKDNI